MPTRSITIDGTTWSVFPSGFITQYDRDEFGLIFANGAGADGEDTIAIRTCCYFSISFDHRLVDGATADGFLAYVKKQLETFPETGV